MRETHLEQAIDALATVSKHISYVSTDLAASSERMDIAYRLLEPSVFCNEYAPDIFASATALLNFCAVSPDFVKATVVNDPPVLWRLILAICTSDQTAVDKAWTTAESIASIPSGLEAFLNLGSVPRLIAVIMGVKGYNNIFSNRLAAVNLLAKFLWNPVKGADAANMLRR